MPAHEEGVGMLAPRGNVHEADVSALRGSVYADANTTTSWREQGADMHLPEQDKNSQGLAADATAATSWDLDERPSDMQDPPKLPPFCLSRLLGQH